MKLVLASLTMLFAIACTTNTTSPGDDSPPPPPPQGDGGNPPPPPPPPGETAICSNDECVCPTGETCSHTCANLPHECHVQGGSDPVDITCNNNLDCHVECSISSSCMVDCGGSASCHVTCPATGCTVTNCDVGNDCVVSCGGAGEASHNGSTATCP